MVQLHHVFRPFLSYEFLGTCQRQHKSVRSYVPVVTYTIHPSTRFNQLLSRQTKPALERAEPTVSNCCRRSPCSKLITLARKTLRAATKRGGPQFADQLPPTSATPLPIPLLPRLQEVKVSITHPAAYHPVFLLTWERGFSRTQTGRLYICQAFIGSRLRGNRCVLPACDTTSPTKAAVQNVCVCVFQSGDS